MKIVCPCTYLGKDGPDHGASLWGYIKDAERLSCVVDGDVVLVAAQRSGEEVPLAEVGIGLWRNRTALGETLASFAAFKGHLYDTRVQLFVGKPITWLE